MLATFLAFPANAAESGNPDLNNADQAFAKLESILKAAHAMPKQLDDPAAMGAALGKSALKLAADGKHPEVEDACMHLANQWWIDEPLMTQVVSLCAAVHPTGKTDAAWRHACATVVQISSYASNARNLLERWDGSRPNSFAPALQLIAERHVSLVAEFWTKADGGTRGDLAAWMVLASKLDDPTLRRAASERLAKARQRPDAPTCLWFPWAHPSPDPGKGYDLAKLSDAPINDPPQRCLQDPLWFEACAVALRDVAPGPAEQAAAQAVKLDPKRWRAHTVLAWVSKTNEASVPAWKQALASAPRSHQGYCYWGLAARTTIEESVVALRESARRHPTLDRFLLGRFLLSLGRYDEAKASFLAIDSAYPGEEAKLYIAISELLDPKADHARIAAELLGRYPTRFFGEHYFHLRADLLNALGSAGQHAAMISLLRNDRTGNIDIALAKFWSFLTRGQIVPAKQVLDELKGRWAPMPQAYITLMRLAALRYEHGAAATMPADIPHDGPMNYAIRFLAGTSSLADAEADLSNESDPIFKDACRFILGYGSLMSGDETSAKRIFTGLVPVPLPPWRVSNWAVNARTSMLWYDSLPADKKAVFQARKQAETGPTPTKPSDF